MSLDLRVPQAMGGPGGGTNPEQLFAVGYAACFQSALAGVGRRRSVDISASVITAKVGIGTIGDGRYGNGRYGLAVELEVSIPGVEPGVARELVEEAHQVCAYSNATRGNIAVKLSVD